eukprot:1958767-Prymnesium_polylepis.1
MACEFTALVLGAKVKRIVRVLARGCIIRARCALQSSEERTRESSSHVDAAHADRDPAQPAARPEAHRPGARRRARGDHGAARRHAGTGDPGAGAGGRRAAVADDADHRAAGCAAWAADSRARPQWRHRRCRRPARHVRGLQ